jgi:hypothetical protein
VARVDLGRVGVITVCLWKWGKKYSMGHVQRMQSMLRRQLTLPHRIVCFTDNPKALPKGVEPAEMPKKLPGDYKALCRMWMYSPKAARLGDRLFQLDLDLVLVTKIDTIVPRPESFVIWKSDSNTEHHYGYNPSVMLITPGARRDIWDAYSADPIGVCKAADAAGWWAATNSDMGVVSYLLQANHPATFTAEDGVLAYRVFAGKHGDRGQTLPDGARIVSFHGPRDPSIPDLQKKSPWIQEHWC